MYTEIKDATIYAAILIYNILAPGNSNTSFLVGYLDNWSYLDNGYVDSFFKDLDYIDVQQLPYAMVFMNFTAYLVGFLGY